MNTPIHPEKMSYNIVVNMLKYVKPNMNVCDPMCGTGLPLIKANAKIITLLDIEEEFIENLKNRRNNLKAEIMDAFSLSSKYNNCFDLVATSPPFFNIRTGGGIAKIGYQSSTNFVKDDVHLRHSRTYSYNKYNISNWSIKNKWQAYLMIFKEIKKSLVDNGIFVLHVKDYIQDRKMVSVADKCEDILVTIGFKNIKREKYKSSKLSLYQLLIKRKLGFCIDYEWIIKCDLGN